MTVIVLYKEMQTHVLCKKIDTAVDIFISYNILTHKLNFVSIYLYHQQRYNTLNI